MYRSVKISDKEILIDGDRYYIVSGWKIENYNGTEYKVPHFQKELTELEFKILERIEDRERKLDRILTDVKPK